MARAVVGDRDRDAAHVAPAMTGEGSIIARHIATSDPELDAENLRIYGIDLILSSLRTQVFHPEGMTKLGLDLATRNLVIVKSTQHFHAGFAPIAKSILYAVPAGALRPDFEAIPYSKLAQEIAGLPAIAIPEPVSRTISHRPLRCGPTEYGAIMTASLNHITITTGQNRASPRAEVPSGIVLTLAPWLQTAIAADKPVALPGKNLPGYTAYALVEADALVMTVYYRKAPVVTFGIAHNGNAADYLWEHLASQFGNAHGIKCPVAPVCAVVLHPYLLAAPDAVGWLGDFERCVAWTWIANINARR
jgi:hypothetical protein